MRPLDINTQSMTDPSYEVGSDASLRHVQEDDLEDALSPIERGVHDHAASALPTLRTVA